MSSVVAMKMLVSPTTAYMTTRDSRQRPNFHRNTAAASAVRAMIVGVSDSDVMSLLSETPSCWRYATSREGTPASQFPIAVDGSTSVTKYPSPTIIATTQAAATRSHARCRAIDLRLCELTRFEYPRRGQLTPTHHSRGAQPSSAMRRGVLGGAHFGRPLDRLPGLAPPRDVRPRRHGHPANAERDAGQDIADEMDTEHDPRERDEPDDQDGGDDGGDAAAARQEAKGDQEQQAAADRRPQRMAGRKRQPRRRRDGIGQHRAGPADDLLQPEPERGTAENRDDEPRRVVPFAVDHIHHRDHRERDAEHIRVEHVADHLSRPHDFRLIDIDPIESLRGGGVEAAQRAPSRANEQ